MQTVPIGGSADCEGRPPTVGLYGMQFDGTALADDWPGLNGGNAEQEVRRHEPLDFRIM